MRRTRDEELKLDPITTDDPRAAWTLIDLPSEQTFRVLDDAGRIRPTEYASIHLMKGLDTRDLSPITNAHNNILDIRDRRAPPAW